MIRNRSIIILVLMLLLTAATCLSQPPVTANVTVTAHEYYDYYTMPDEKKWKKVKMLRIEGQTTAGSIQVYQNGPDTTLQATLANLAVPSEYWVTVVWQDGEKYYQSFVTSPQKEITHTIYNP